MQLTISIFASVVLLWTLVSAAKDGYEEARKPAVRIPFGV